MTSRAATALRSLSLALVFAGSLSLSALSADAPRTVISQALLAEDAEQQAALIGSLAENGASEITLLLTAWRQGEIYLYDTPDATRIPILLDGPADAEGKQFAHRVDTNEPLKDASGAPVQVVASELTQADTDSSLRKVMKSVLDVQALVAPDVATRKNAVTKLGMEQNPARLPVLQARQQKETDPAVQESLREAIALIQLKSEDPQAQIAACKELAEQKSLLSKDFLTAVITEQKSKAGAEGTSGMAASVTSAAEQAVAAIDGHLQVVNFFGTIFRGLSNGSVLLVVAMGLAITFGLMGVINMAHGELMVVGAYATYLVQNFFAHGIALSPFGMKLWIPGLNAAPGSLLHHSYFVVALPIAFLSAALVGVILERGIIQFLYRRPLESLLATWGVSLVLQQLFRLVFGANNVQVDSPAWLSGNWTIDDVSLGWNRVFVIGFAIVIIFGTWAILNKTPLGLLIRAVMQNRQMAACMGVRTERVNMLTFGFGSGLAGLAGAFLTQIANVGPSLGQSYIVDAFMTVVVGGVGSVAGTVFSALGIGVIDQSLQQILLNPVLGKILVLAAIILFLQWRPSGLFVTKSRSLES